MKVQFGAMIVRVALNPFESALRIPKVTSEMTGRMQEELSLKGLLALFVGAGLLLSSVAGAAELSREKLSQSTDVAHCAAIGPGYVRVEGTDACARIGERMRVEMNVHRPPPFLGGFAQPFDLDPAPDGPARARLRLETAPARDPGRPISR